MRSLIAIVACLCWLACPTSAADLPEDAARALAAFEKKKSEIDARTTADVAKEKDALGKALQKVLEKETKAHHSDAVRKLNDYLEDPANKSTINLPEEASDTLAQFETKKKEIENKAGAEIAKHKEVFAKALVKAQERETKAGHADVATAIRQCLDAHGEKAASAAPAPGAPPAAAPAPTGRNPSWPDFVKSLKVVSIGGWNDSKATAITIGDWSMPTGLGLNVVAMVDGKRVIEKSFHNDNDYQTLFDEVEKLPAGAYVVMAMRQDSGSTPFSTKAQKALRACGGRQGLDGQPGTASYLLIGIKGGPSNQSIERAQVEKIEYPFPPKK
ncbi:MAG: hypothetical protein H0W83_02095 [Planctomycetes bacterium]|nr:hypothetical protein [Planctomycetota bacterium]